MEYSSDSSAVTTALHTGMDSKDEPHERQSATGALCRIGRRLKTGGFFAFTGRYNLNKATNMSTYLLNGYKLNEAEAKAVSTRITQESQERQERAMAARARRAAKAAGFWAVKSRTRTVKPGDHGEWMILDAFSGFPVAGWDYDFSAQDVIDWCTDYESAAA